MQLRFTSFTVTSSWRDLHPQECAHAGRTKKSGHPKGWPLACTVRTPKRPYSLTAYCLATWPLSAPTVFFGSSLRTLATSLALTAPALLPQLLRMKVTISATS
ncbi:MAG: hypothetical protein GAK35_01107 [Herbaspirillum frisingense]|uniref:Uncharacterized protein n=1 Tax=Herbaspirillum frisingense TaxID=92645 RepID=A0A7V8FYQ3_9BURK|nr:MAG: hypothetical protein GAK35_01107 [Herbaspirillum frisingense]